MDGCSRLIGLTLLVAISTTASASDRHESRETVLAEVIELSEQHALNTGEVDWPAVKTAAAGILQQDKTDAGLSASIRFVLAKLEDRHSSYRPSATPARTDQPPASAPAPAPIAASSQSPGGHPVLAVNAWSGRDARQAAKDVRSELVSMLHQERCGIIVDFSHNRGGNMWPMVAGVLPVLSEGLLGGFREREGERTSIVSTGNGLLLSGSPHFLNAVDLPQPEFRPRHIAVIIGSRTASSGEITALLFRGQENARFFGQKTAGVPTGNRTFKLENGAMLHLTVAVTFDRSGREHLEPLVPDVETATPVEAADSWINSMCDSRGAS